MDPATGIRCKPSIQRRIVPTLHSLKRLLDGRQEGITLFDAIQAASSIPGYIPRSTRFRNFVSRSGKRFDIVLRDLPRGRMIITIIGKE
jgi:hypothetical protein